MFCFGRMVVAEETFTMSLLKNLNVINEHFVEHVHSVIRRQTKVSDTDEQIREKCTASLVQVKDKQTGAPPTCPPRILFSAGCN